MPHDRDMTDDELRAARTRADVVLREAAVAVAMTRTAVAQRRALIEAAKRAKTSERNASGPWIAERPDGAVRRATSAFRAAGGLPSSGVACGAGNAAPREDPPYDAGIRFIV